MAVTASLLDLGRRLARSPGARAALRPPFAAALRAARFALGVDRRLERAYFAQNRVRKLQIGSGPHRVAGWLDTDSFPLGADVRRLDARRRFPFPDASFDYVFSEHIIEHLALADGVHMLAETFRVLRPGGTMRIATPDLDFLVRLLRPDRSALEDAYIGWALGRHMPGAEWAGAGAVVNHYVRAWGHCFIYDRATLEAAIRRAGFAAITPVRIGESEDPELTGLENEARMPPGFLALESMAYEAVKPGG